MEAYLDNSATTRAFESVKDIVVKTMMEDFGNPSSLHKKGVEAERYVKAAAEAVAKTLKADPSEIIFTSGGTESNNMAIIGAARANRRAGKHIITSTIEHASVYNVFGWLEEEGWRVDYIPVDENGHLDQKALEAAIDEETTLVSVMYVNNEIGAVNPIGEIGALIKQKNPKTIFHVDAIQAYGKYRINPKKEHIDLLSVSGHKIHGPKGVGFLYVKNGTKIVPVVYGGGQQKGMRSGTHNVPGIAGMGVAAAQIYENYEEKRRAMYAVKKLFVDLVRELPGTTVNGLTGEDSAPHVVSVSFDGIRSEVLLHSLEERGIYVSSGSACSSNHPAVSGTLKGIGVKRELLDSTLRFSFSVFTTEEEIRYCAGVLAELLPMLRRYRRM
ncbi:cysteine desulfurase family protein [Fusibacillus kribbianus]|uniref:Cysteine desulfurase family protein n=1 Tax=Fusibacillus kribbianus TaxID=3044208 RepID=A0AAP4BDD3_9FIRM|nr:cysteine desulfurase family protein [Ruminococcus sp. YH-rum2234]MDI9242284.1 cysteine desulfurase family protein [Ruminococcus sp. YH-rum2234]